MLVTIFQLADELNLPAAWLKQEAKAGRIPCLKVGNRWRFNVEAVQADLARRAAQHTSEAKVKGSP